MPLLQKLDNEVSASLKKYMQQNEVNYPLVPRYLQGQNTAERAIRCFKDHFIVGLSSTGKNWPMNLWCRFLPQCTATLNLLCRSQINPQLSAYSNSLHTRNSTVLLISTKHHSHPLEQESPSMRSPVCAKPRHHMVLMAGTSDQH